MSAKVLCVGLGGVGTIGALGLEYEKKAEVTAVIRSDYDHVTTKGFQIESIDYGTIESYKPTNVVKSVEEAVSYGPFKYIVISTKNLPDLSKLEDLVEPAVTDSTVIVLVQNGIGIEEPFFVKYPKNIILSGVSMISSTNYQGKIEHENVDAINFGYFQDHPTIKDTAILEASARDFISIYSNSKNHVGYDGNVKYARWRKLIYNATLNTVCCLTDLDVGRVECFGGIDTIIKPLMKEITQLAKSDGVELDESIMDLMIRSDDGIWYSPSMLIDVRKKQCIELEVILGNALKIGKKHGCEVVFLPFLYNLLTLVQSRLKEGRGIIVLPKERPIPEAKI